MKKIFGIIGLVIIIIFVLLGVFLMLMRKENEPLLKVEINDEVVNSNVYVVKASYIDNGINISIHIEEENSSLIIKGTKESYQFNLNKTSDNTYSGDIKLNSLKNDTYFLIIKGTSNYYLTNTLDLLDKINRSKIGNKLVTFNYDNNIMSFKVENFNYKYDILIDPGHGGVDIGASNDTMKERELNLMVSLYEKERYEEMGLKVLLSRSDDSDGMMMGDTTNWNRAKLRGYAIGYYGVLCRMIYSNHHNSSEYANDSGFEIIVSNDQSDLTLENSIINDFKKVYPSNLITNKYQLYSRDIDSGIVYNKINNEVYSYIDYYATTRLPEQLFNVKIVTYEDAYMSNSDNFKWYYEEENWKKVSEVKIKHYVEALGKVYIPKN